MFTFSWPHKPSNDFIVMHTDWFSFGFLPNHTIALIASVWVADRKSNLAAPENYFIDTKKEFLFHDKFLVRENCIYSLKRKSNFWDDRRQQMTLGENQIRIDFTNSSVVASAVVTENAEYFRFHRLRFGAVSQLMRRARRKAILDIDFDSRLAFEENKIIDYFRYDFCYFDFWRK